MISLNAHLDAANLVDLRSSAQTDPSSGGFSAALRSAGESSKPGAADDRRSQAQAAAEQLISSTFVLPILGELHSSTLAGDRFTPGAAERRFQPLLDQHLADHIVQSAQFPLVGQIRDQLLGDRPAAFPVPAPEIGRIKDTVA